MTASLIMSISRSDLSKLVPLPNASITEPKHLASYNWLEADTPAIVVPGLPSFWRQDSYLRQLKKDSGLIYVAQNAAHHPESPMEPLFRALYVENPRFDISSVDIVSDRNCIRKLLAFVDPGSEVHGAKDFTIRMELVDGTAILEREEEQTQEFVGPDQFKGYGHEFEKAYTTSKIPSSTAHHRILSYRLGGLSFLIRHETDGYVDAGAPARIPKQEAAGDDLSDLLGSISISRPAVTEDITFAASRLTVRRGGHPVALESALEIKTKVWHRPLAIADVAAQLWLSQTPKLVRAYHNNGCFGVPDVEDVSADVKQWEAANQDNLGRLVALLVNIIAEAKPDGNVEIRYDSLEDVLLVEQCTEKKMFPADLYEKWKDDDLEISKHEVKGDGMPSSWPHATAGAASNAETTGTNMSQQPSATIAGTPKDVQAQSATEPELPCFVCQRMRDGNPKRHGSLVSTGEIRNCLLCARDFCEKHVSREERAVCEIDHGAYYQKHRTFPGVYASLAARNLTLGDCE